AARGYFVEMPRAIVPIDADLLCAAADAREPEEEPVIGAVEMARCERELAQLLPHRAFVQHAIISRQRATVAVQKFADCISRQLAVLECARDAFAHQRIDA